MEDALIPFIALTSVFGSSVIIVAIVMFVEYRKQVMRSKERLAAIEKGLPVADLSKECQPSPRSGKRYLQKGISLLFVGTGLAGALYISFNHSWWVWGAFVAFIGLGNLFYWFLVERHETRPGGTGNVDGCC